MLIPYFTIMVMELSMMSQNQVVYYPIIPRKQQDGQITIVMVFLIYLLQTRINRNTAAHVSFIRIMGTVLLRRIHNKSESVNSKCLQKEFLGVILIMMAGLIFLFR